MEIRLFNREKLPRHFVALAVELKDCQPSHAGILIRLNEVHYFHHFPGMNPPEVIEGYDNDGGTIYSVVDWLGVDDESETAAILAICRGICEKSDITYSYIIDGSTYNHLNDFISQHGLPELGTCVGFCINTLNRFLIDAECCVNVDEWDDLNCVPFIDQQSRRAVKQKFPAIDWSLYERFHKRISPLEYLALNSRSKYPIARGWINANLPILEEKMRILANCS